MVKGERTRCTWERELGVGAGIIRPQRKRGIGKVSPPEHETGSSAVDPGLAEVPMSSGERALFAAEWSWEEISETRNWG